MDVLKEKAYLIIQKMQEATKGEIYVEWDTFKAVMLTFCKNENDIANFWAAYHIDGKFFYQDQLLQLVNPA